MFSYYHPDKKAVVYWIIIRYSSTSDFLSMVIIEMIDDDTGIFGSGD